MPALKQLYELSPKLLKPLKGDAAAPTPQAAAVATITTEVSDGVMETQGAAAKTPQPPLLLPSQSNGSGVGTDGADKEGELSHASKTEKPRQQNIATLRATYVGRLFDDEGKTWRLADIYESEQFNGLMGQYYLSSMESITLPPAHHSDTSKFEHQKWSELMDDASWHDPDIPLRSAPVASASSEEDRRALSFERLRQSLHFGDDSDAQEAGQQAVHRQGTACCSSRQVLMLHLGDQIDATNEAISTYSLVDVVPVVSE